MRFMARKKRMVLALLASGLLWGCRPALDEPSPRVKVPRSLPEFSAKTPAAGVAQRAQELADEATPALAAGDPVAAIPKLTEALALDGGHIDARFGLAKAFVQAGLGSVALELLTPLAARQQECGWCVEALQSAKTDKDFARFVQTERGAALLRDVPDTPLPYATWSKALLAIIQQGKFQEMAKWAHPARAFQVARSCPDCPDERAKVAPTRSFVGPTMLGKVLSRFEHNQPGIGTPLYALGEPTCTGRCCKWRVPQPVPAGEVALAEICLRADTPAQPSLTRIALVFAPNPAPASPQQ